MRLTPSFRGAGLALAAAAGLSPAAAGTLQINPVMVEIDGGRRSGSVTITNVEAVPVVIRAYALGWRQEGGEDRYDDSAAMIVSPPVFTIPPGGTQIVRVGPRADSGAALAYRLIVEEVPEAAPGTGIRVALRLNLPLYLHMPGGAASDLAWSARRGTDGHWTVEARNPGRGWVRVDARVAEAATGLRFADGFVFGTVLPGGARRWTIGPSPQIADNRQFTRIQTHSDGTPLASLAPR